jgi:hypothetical protein
MIMIEYKYIDIPDDVLPADGALRHLLAAVGAGAHVAALQHHAVDLGTVRQVGAGAPTGESMQILHIESSSMVSPSSRFLCSCRHSLSSIFSSSAFSTQPLKFTLKKAQ